MTSSTIPTGVRRRGAVLLTVFGVGLALLALLLWPAPVPDQSTDCTLASVRLSRGNDDPSEPDRETAEIGVSLIAGSGHDNRVVIHWTALNTSGSSMFAGRGTQYLLRLLRPGNRDLVNLMTLDHDGAGRERLAASLSVPDVARGRQAHHHLTVELGEATLTEHRFIQQEIEIIDRRNSDGTRQFKVSVQQNNLGGAFGRLDTPLRLFDVSALPGRWLGELPVVTARYPDRSEFRRRANLTVPTKASPIETAFAAGDVDAVRRLVDTDPAADRMGLREPMVRAVLDADHAALEAMLTEGCDPDGLGSIRTELPADRIRARMTLGEKLSPLQLAARLGDATACQLLIENGAELDGGAHYGGPPLALAIEQGHRDVVTLLIDAGTPIRLGLHIAIATNDVSMAQMLASLAPESVNEPADNTGETALMLAVREGRVEIATLLIGGHSAVDTVDLFGHDVLWHARTGGSEAALRLVTTVFVESASRSPREITQSMDRAD